MKTMSFLLVLALTNYALALGGPKLPEPNIPPPVNNTPDSKQLETAMWSMPKPVQPPVIPPATLVDLSNADIEALLDLYFDDSGNLKDEFMGTEHQAIAEKLISL